MKYRLLRKLPGYMPGETWYFKNINNDNFDSLFIEAFGTIISIEENEWQWKFFYANMNNPEWFEEINKCNICKKNTPNYICDRCSMQLCTSEAFSEKSNKIEKLNTGPAETDMQRLCGSVLITNKINEIIDFINNKQ